MQFCAQQIYVKTMKMYRKHNTCFSSTSYMFTIKWQEILSILIIYKLCRCSNDSRDYSFATLENINVPYTRKSVCYCINWGYVINGNDSGYLSNNICWG
jgi:hypothetical protein